MSLRSLLIVATPYVYVGWLRLVGSLKLQVSFAKEPYERDDILHKGPMILKSLRIVTTPYVYTTFSFRMGWLRLVGSLKL